MGVARGVPPWSQPSPLAAGVGGVQLLLEVVELLCIVRVRGGRVGPSHDGRVLVEPVTRKTAGRKGLGGVWAIRTSRHSHGRGF